MYIYSLLVIQVCTLYQSACYVGTTCSDFSEAHCIISGQEDRGNASTLCNIIIADTNFTHMCNFTHGIWVWCTLGLGFLCSATAQLVCCGCVCHVQVVYFCHHRRRDASLRSSMRRSILRYAHDQHMTDWQLVSLLWWWCRLWTQWRRGWRRQRVPTWRSRCRTKYGSGS